MNDKQLYTSSTPQERLEAVVYMLIAIRSRQEKHVLAHGRLIHERRRFTDAHYIHERRTQGAGRRGWLYRAIYISILMTVSIATFLIASHIPIHYGAPLIFIYDTGLFAILLIKPYKRRTHYAYSN